MRFFTKFLYEHETITGEEFEVYLNRPQVSTTMIKHRNSVSK